jgi:membrane-bound metal-dependent hydrolase YbcI (DUF457 family)
MMGRHHAASGAVAGIALGLLAHQPAATTLAAGALCAGAAMAPDVDEPGSSVARAAEPVSGAIAYLTARLAGGHREATHSLLAAAAAGGAVAALGVVSVAPHVPASVVPLGVCVALCARAVPPRALRIGRTAALCAGAIAAWAIARWVGIGWWVPAAVGLGWAIHVAGDAITAGGVPVLWPWRRRVSWPVLARTGSPREAILGVALLLALVALAAAPAMSVARTVGL